MSLNNTILNPNENLTIPSWINVDYFIDILAKDEPQSVGVQNFKPIAAIAPGENFLSIMLRIHMDLDMKDGSLKHKTYVLKTMMDDDAGGALVNNLSYFPKEMEMYNKYLPAFDELYKAVDFDIQLAPKCLFTETKDGRINFVFEDLSSKNFKNIEKFKGCDMLHMKRVLKKLAEFHAASAVYVEQNGAYPADFQIGFVDPVRGFNLQEHLYFDKVESYKKAMKLWDLKDVDKYIEKFPTFDQYWKCCLSSLKQNTNQFNVLTHGDFWSSNIMFSYLPTGVINDLMLVDFQTCKWGSPVEDLLFFITLSAAKDIRIKEFDQFVAIYHERLIECLKVLGYKKPLPQLRDLHKDLFDQRNTFSAFFSCFNHLAGIMLPNDKDTSIHSFSRQDEFGEQFRMNAFTNPHFVEAAKDLFPFYHQRGIFNFEDFDEN